MKKILILLAALLAGTIAVFAVIPPAVNARQDAVVIREERFAGDPAAAEGFAVTLRTSSGGRLHWATGIAFGEEVASETAFRLTLTRESGRGQRVPTLEIGTQLGGYGVRGGDIEAENFDVLRRMVQAAMDAAAPGETKTVRLSVPDYFSCAPLTVYANNEEGYDVFENESFSGLYGTFWPNISGFFHLPVGEDAEAEITVAKDHEGRVGEVQIEFSGLTVAWVNTSVAYLSDGSAYLALSCGGEDGEPVQVDGPAGQGVLHVPIKVLRTSQNEPYLRVESDRITTAWPTDAAVAGLNLSGDESRLLVETWEDDEYWLNVVARPEMESVQRIQVGESYSLCRVWDDEIVVIDRTNLRMWHWEDGQYRLKIDAELPPEFEDLYDAVFCYDGARLLMTRLEMNYQNTLQTAVCDETGLLYAARLHHSLDYLPAVFPDALPEVVVQR